MKACKGTWRNEAQTWAGWTFCPPCHLTMWETFSRRPQINVSPWLICSAIFWKPDGSASRFMGSMRRGCSASVPVITHTSLQDTAGRSLQPPLCLLSVSPSRLNAFDCTAHHQAEVFAHRCITLCTAPFLYSPAQGAKEQWLTDHWREVRLVSGPSLWSWDQCHIILL